ncbi:MAG: hypothetical protein ACK40Q_09070, partial [Pseudothermotoga sp.]
LFHIWAIENIDEAIEILTGQKAGKMTRSGNYERGSVNDRVVKALKKAKELAGGKNIQKRKKRAK